MVLIIVIFIFFVEIKQLLISTFLLGVVHALVIHENIVFYKQNEVSITCSDWLLTFVIDLKLMKIS